MKPFNGKAIYQPAGKAAEYSRWTCNFYVGCSNGCEYCYCKKGIMADNGKCSNSGQTINTFQIAPHFPAVDATQC